MDWLLFFEENSNASWIGSVLIVARCFRGWVLGASSICRHNERPDGECNAPGFTLQCHGIREHWHYKAKLYWGNLSVGRQIRKLSHV